MEMVLQSIILGVTLAMDAFSISVSKALATQKTKLSTAFKLGVVFGGFQTIMPLIGYLVGNSFYLIIKDYFNFVSFAILAFIGGKMIFECLKGEATSKDDIITFKELMFLGVATSIDALAAGFVFSGNGILTVIGMCFIIGIITFLICFIGYIFGCRLGSIIGEKGEIIGGIVLILLGVKILLDYFIK